MTYFFSTLFFDNSVLYIFWYPDGSSYSVLVITSHTIDKTSNLNPIDTSITNNNIFSSTNSSTGSITLTLNIQEINLNPNNNSFPYKKFFLINIYPTSGGLIDGLN